MGFFNWFKRDKSDRDENEDRDNIVDETQVEIEKVNFEKEADNYDSTPKRKKYIQDSCESIVEASRQIDEAKVEYQAVTSYLTDMQKIDAIPVEERADLEDSARKIITLTRDRTGYQNRKDIKITDVQYQHMEQYEEEIPEEIIKIKKNEEYLIIVKNDMRALEGEKGSLHFNKEEILKQQQYLKGIAIIISFLVVGLLSLFATIASVFYKNMMIPYILTIIMAVISAVYVFYEARRNIYETKLTEQKLNRAIGLLNKVKIKYVNTTNLLDYSYNKHRVNSSSELKYLWEQYMKAKDEERRYKNNTELLNYYNEVLVKNLRKFKIADPDIWIYQAIAIIDNREMVEVRHRLNVRRAKLRERIDYNTKLKQDGMEKIQKLISKDPDWKKEVVESLKKYDINI
ncbi:hypothetical protein EDD66_10629 [Mobilisporobacter senegalensis]|uniref:Uncharacterized protein n=1 Tax=Mobilisporobacter senegalensis TaxID=1329262 RepID=A0A3N1XKU7_9FIRM|nr:hypothetical protein [Mobilisporobacter senegalensis]ROR27334.1 hypothetical protein EDD66_10629 [Mobilisporobacter senegalensis]